MAHRARLRYSAPKQSKFRVGAVLRFVRPDGSEGTISAVNAEPHDANIRGAICAERAALCQFQRDEAGCGAKICRVVCVTDAPQPIFPGPCCREFLVATCAPETEVVVSGSAEPEAFVTEPLRELLPLPSAYCRRGQDEMKALGESLEAKVGPPPDPHFAVAYAAAVACARRQGKQKAIFPVLFAAAARWPSGRAHAVAELKGMEYGCTVDAVSLLLPELLRARAESDEVPDCIVQVDHYGVAHAPFASARSLLIEHGLGNVMLIAHTAEGIWAEPITARESMPHATHMEMELDKQ
jgi:cytidine deaminase